MGSPIFRWPWAKKKRVLPSYSGFRSVVLGDVAPDLAAAERSEAGQTQMDEIQSRLVEGAERPTVDTELFTVLIAADDSGVITITPPSRQPPILALFSNRVRAADYHDELLGHGTAPRFRVLTATQLLGLLSSLRDAGIREFALDRCPRCSTFATVTIAESASEDTLIRLWAISKATELGRLNLYLTYAQTLATGTQFDLARQVAYETIAHVAPDSPQAHLLLGELGIALKDRRLVREAETFLRFLRAESFATKLLQDAQLSAADFTASELSAPLSARTST
ncbi:MAG: hypothetical protein QOC81_227 [Thermoanaerobaculia bacterium]|jgi:hypothetical protein|nr:hypothetical protein [Thermoanaerobaculia bacterium]